MGSEGRENPVAETDDCYKDQDKDYVFYHQLIYSGFIILFLEDNIFETSNPLVDSRCDRLSQPTAFLISMLSSTTYWIIFKQVILLLLTQTALLMEVTYLRHLN